MLKSKVIKICNLKSTRKEIGKEIGTSDSANRRCRNDIKMFRSYKRNETTNTSSKYSITSIHGKARKCDTDAMILFGKDLIDRTFENN